MSIYHPTPDGSYTCDSRILQESLDQESLDLNELYRTLSEESPDVFVSHKSDDKHQAEKVAITIARCGLTAYLDIWDPDVNGDGPELVDYINSVIARCNSLIAVVSPNTVRSWWVPLEIGIAITRDLRLGTFSETVPDLPSYLWKWPVLRNTEELEIWCNSHDISTTEKFHRSVRAALNQD